MPGRSAIVTSRTPSCRVDSTNRLEVVRSRRPPRAPVEVAQRPCFACLLRHIATKAGRTLHWGPVNRRFKNDDEANAMLSQPQRWPYVIG